MDQLVDKTDKGREEIASRRYQLSPRLRTLLVMVDGKHTARNLLEKVTALGLGEPHLDELLQAGFIQRKEIHPEAETAAPTVDAHDAEQEQPASFEAMIPAALPSETSTVASSSPLTPAQRFEAVYKLYAETIRDVLGLRRGLTLQFKVEKAGTLEAFEDLRLPFIEAVLKAEGRDAARDFRDRLDALLYLGQQPHSLSELLP